MTQEELERLLKEASQIGSIVSYSASPMNSLDRNFEIW
jgi:hypothetical protein